MHGTSAHIAAWCDSDRPSNPIHFAAEKRNIYKNKTKSYVYAFCLLFVAFFLRWHLSKRCAAFRISAIATKTTTIDASYKRAKAEAGEVCMMGRAEPGPGTEPGPGPRD